MRELVGEIPVVVAFDRLRAEVTVSPDPWQFLLVFRSVCVCVLFLIVHHFVL